MTARLVVYPTLAVLTVAAVVVAARDPGTPVGAAKPWDAYLTTSVELDVQRDLRDADSARFRNVTMHAVPGYPYERAVCGEVNSRNGFGGYAGFRRFGITYVLKNGAAWRGPLAIGNDYGAVEVACEGPRVRPDKAL